MQSLICDRRYGRALFPCRITSNLQIVEPPIALMAAKSLSAFRRSETRQVRRNRKGFTP
jgi:hypothetical protein